MLGVQGRNKLNFAFVVETLNYNWYSKDILHKSATPLELNKDLTLGTKFFL